MENGIKQITLGQVKQIAAEVSKHYELINRGNYYNIINRKTRECSIQGGDKNLTFGNFYNIIEYSYLKLIDENGLYFDWSSYGVDTTNARKNYVFRIQDKIVELICGFNTKIGA